ncbi:hypothetical protein AC579_2243 [Pseudocercospora musae]|uniref:Nephrocystin 3-like N-terminal domain-containing protein n=1 Tax=Pseudocercospora musae TaxID=113226 RepID=A0A139IUN4_9PEZI|nr:hypothetical protein AC579_2243 [Pseudocercospora musae]
MKAYHTRCLRFARPDLRVQGDIATLLETQQESFETLRDIRSDDQMRQLKDKLSPADPMTNHHKGLKQRHPGTCKWFLDSDRFQCWKQSEDPPALWLHGQPGAGKSVACSAIIENVLLTMQSSTTFVAYFYFDFSDISKQALEAALKSILYQLARQSDKVFRSLMDYTATMSLSLPKMRQVFESLLAEMASAVIVLDALDEAEPCGDVLEWLAESINCVNLRDVRWIFTSRDYSDIRRALTQDTSKVSPVSLDADLVDHDIRSYVDARVHKDSCFQRWADRADDQALIIESLMEKSCGMFRWAACQLDDLAGCLTLKELKDTLARLPTSLPETYSRMLQKIPPARKDGAIRLLQFLMLSPNPLELGEAANVLAMNIDGGTLYERDKELPDHSELALYCPGLIMIVHINDYSGATREELQLSHFSVKEYLLSTEVHKEFCADLSTAEASSMATVLLLRSFIHWFHSLPADLTEQKREARRRWTEDNFPLARYAAFYWTDFAREGEVQDKTQKYIVEFLADQSTFECLLQCNRTFLGDSDVEPVYIATEARLLQTATALVISYGLPLDIENYFGCTPLHLACHGGDLATAEFLVDHGADVTKRDNYGYTILHSVAKGGFLQLLEYTISKDIPVDIENDSGNTPLHLACWEGRLAAAKFLVDHGADVTKRDNYGYTILHFAAKAGSLQLLEYTISNDIPVDVKNDFGETPLYLACRRGDLATAEFLVDHGADVTKRDNYGNTVFHLATKSHDPSALLLEYVSSVGLPVDVQNDWGETPLHLASEWPANITALKFLVEAGADINKKNYRGHSPLGTAIQTVVMSFLRELGATEPDLDEKGYPIPYHWKIRKLLDGWWKLLRQHPSTKHERYNDEDGNPEYHSEDEYDETDAETSNSSGYGYDQWAHDRFVNDDEEYRFKRYRHFNHVRRSESCQF